ncbi:MAG TPA: NIPSNAP family protein [Blastocatellia bacterium]|nr:NIPSNAP family protein [Blastocatellia bacterium]
MILLKVTYRVRAHHLPEFERIFETQIKPLIVAHGLRFGGLWRTLVGEVGEYLELWEFASLAEFDEQWHKLLTDPRLLAIFQLTGPMVEGEKFTLLEPVANNEQFLVIPPLQP